MFELFLHCVNALETLKEVLCVCVGGGNGEVWVALHTQIIGNRLLPRSLGQHMYSFNLPEFSFAFLISYS